ncbi:MAG: DnaA/Hda family protein [Planctomycetia bacterium]|nr:DnaA/Hda family protein [Planctomycetia bacterium]
MNIVSIPLYEKASSRLRSTAFAGTDGGEAAPKYRLRQFLAGPENHVLAAAIHEILIDGSPKFPILFYGPLGFGKSHLVSGTFYAWQSLHPEGTGKVVEARNFLRQWQTFLKTQKLSEFYHIYHRLDFLVLEDMHEVSLDDQAQGMLVFLLERLRQRNARFLMTSDCPLAELDFQSKLASRIREGVCLRIALSGEEARREILSLEENSRGMKFSDDALELLAHYSTVAEHSVYEMLNVKRQLEMLRKTSGSAAVTSGDVRLFFEQKAENCKITIHDIAKLAAKHFKVKLADLRGKSRQATLVLVRDVVYYLARRMTGFTLAEIGAYFGGRDHTTILHGCSQLEEQLKVDSALRLSVERLYGELRPLIDTPVVGSR